MPVRYFQETDTEWKDAIRPRKHIYLIDGYRCVGYVREGSTELRMFNKPLPFSKTGRKFKELTKTAFQKANYTVIKKKPGELW